METESKDTIMAESSSAAVPAVIHSTTSARPPADIYNEKGEQVFTKKYLLEKIAFEKAERGKKSLMKAKKPKRNAEKRPLATASSNPHNEDELAEIPNANKRIVEWAGRPMQMKFGGNMVQQCPQLSPSPEAHDQENASIEMENLASAFSMSRFDTLCKEAGAIALSTDEEIRRLKNQIKIEKSLRLGAESANRLLREQLKKEKDWHAFAVKVAEKQEEQVVELCKQVVTLEEQLEDAKENTDLESKMDYSEAETEIDE